MASKPLRERRKGTPRAWVARRMRLPLIIAALACSLGHATEAVPPAKDRFNSRMQGLRIEVGQNGWGKVNRADIETLLYAVADELLARMPRRLDATISVSHGDGGPIVLYERGARGEYRVRLHASGDRWHLYAYEFAHELCHILANYERNATGGDTTGYNQWFEETLCETASLYVLQALAQRWQDTPPSPSWGAAAGKFKRFHEHLLSEGHRQLPAHTPLHAWLVDNENALRANPYLRERNEVVANLLLPLFSDNPQNWAALNYLNLSRTDAQSSLQDYLHRWYQRAPLEHRQFIGSVLALFGLEAVSPAGTLAVANAAEPAERPAQPRRSGS